VELLALPANIRLGRKILTGTNTLAYYTAASVTKKKFLKRKHLGSCSQHFIFFITYEWAKQARALHYTKRERLVKGKRSNLMGPSLSNEDSEVL
jgi:hypothetical protein